MWSDSSRNRFPRGAAWVAEGGRPQIMNFAFFPEPPHSNFKKNLGLTLPTGLMAGLKNTEQAHFQFNTLRQNCNYIFVPFLFHHPPGCRTWEATATNNLGRFGGRSLNGFKKQLGRKPGATCCSSSVYPSLYAGMSSNFTRWPTLRAGFCGVVRLMSGLPASNMRSTLARVVFIVSAMSLLERDFCSRSLANCMAIAGVGLPSGCSYT
jgi:hypothetical protein